MVNEAQLADVARQLDLGRHLLLGKGEIQSNGMEKNSLLANAMEAIIAAIYLDSGFEGAFGFIAFHFDQLISSCAHLDHRTGLQKPASRGRAKRHQGSSPVPCCPGKRPGS